MTSVPTDVDIDVAGVDAWLDANWNPDLPVRDWWARLAGAGLASPMLPPPYGRAWPRAPPCRIRCQVPDLPGWYSIRRSRRSAPTTW